MEVEVLVNLTAMVLNRNVAGAPVGRALRDHRLYPEKRPLNILFQLENTLFGIQFSASLGSHADVSRLAQKCVQVIIITNNVYSPPVHCKGIIYTLP